jgi:hypothetical protein
MGTDGQGRPLSDDGQWAWTGTEWVPAALGAGPAAGHPIDPNATIAGPSPFAAGASPEAGQPTYGETSIAHQPGPAYGGAPAGYGGPSAPTYGGAPAGYTGAPAGYGVAPGPPPYGAAAPGYGVYPPQIPTTTSARRRKRLVIGISSVIVLVAVAIVLIVTLTHSKKSGPLGAFSCTAPGTPGTGTITFKKGNVFTLEGDPAPHTYVRSGDRLTLQGGELNGVVATYDSGSKTLEIPLTDRTLTCKS